MENFEKIENQIDELIYECNDKSLFNELISKLKKNNINDDNWYLLYLIGYLYFNIPNQVNDDQLKALGYLGKSYSLNKDNQFVGYYYGFILYDLNKFEDSLDCFEKIDIDYFIENDLKWRFYKIKEMRTCTKLFLTKEKEAFCLLVSSFSEEYIKIVKTEKEENYNFPIDFIRAAYIVSKENNWLCYSFVSILKLIELLEIKNEYKEEYLHFKTPAGAGGK